MRSGKKVYSVTGEIFLRGGNDWHAQSRLKFERNALFCETGAHRGVIPERNNVLTAGLDHAARILHFLLSVASHARCAAATVSAEEGLPARTRAHAHLERALGR